MASPLPRCLDAWAPSLEHLRISNGNFNTEHRERDWCVDDECPFAVKALQVEHLTYLKELELVRLVVPLKALRNLTQLTSDNLWEKIEEFRDLLEQYRLLLLESLFVWSYMIVSRTTRTFEYFVQKRKYASSIMSWILTSNSYLCYSWTHSNKYMLQCIFVCHMTMLQFV